MPKKSSKTPGRDYPKPYDGFPLSAHTHTGRWYKVIKGRRHYFGPLDDWETAFKLYEHQAPFLARGEKPPPLGVDTLKSVSQVLNAFLEAKRRMVDSGEMTERSWAEYHKCGEMVVRILGRSRDIDTLTPDDFGKLRAHLAKGRSPVTLGNLITRTRSMFKFAVDEGLTDRAIRYGTQFSKPKPRTVKVDRQSKPRKVFTAKEIHALLAVSDAPMRAMILLGINAGLGNTDLSNLTYDDIDLDAGVIALYRQKTGADRRGVLWPEAIDALREAIEQRPAHQDKKHAKRVFITTHGREWVRTVVHRDKTPSGRERSRVVRSDNVAQRFNILLGRAKVGKGGRGFYTLRHTFRTVADELRDRPAVDLVMGHENNTDMRSQYVDSASISNERLRAVSDHVHAWLYGPKKRVTRKTRRKRG